MASSLTAVEAGGSGLHGYSPISTLERQYAGNGTGRIFVFVKTNAACCLAGGVEENLNQRKTSSKNPNSSTLVATEQQEYYEEDGSSSHQEGSVVKETSNGDPFSFLHDDSQHDITPQTH